MTTTALRRPPPRPKDDQLCRPRRLKRPPAAEGAKLWPPPLSGGRGRHSHRPDVWETLPPEVREVITIAVEVILRHRQRLGAAKNAGDIQVLSPSLPARIT